MKRTYLAVYDYGQGGIWVLIDAPSPDEVTTKYPELEVVLDRPDWLDDDLLDQIRDQLHFDVDDEPKGWLRTLVDNR